MKCAYMQITTFAPGQQVEAEKFVRIMKEAGDWTVALWRTNSGFVVAFGDGVDAALTAQHLADHLELIFDCSLDVSPEFY